MNDAKRSKRRLINNSIRKQILIPFLLLITMAGAIVAVVSYLASVKNTTEALTENVEGQIINLNDTFELFFTNTNQHLERFVANELLTNSENKADLLQYFKETQETTPTIANVYTVFDSTGDTIIYPETDFSKDFVPTERDWYKNAVKANGNSVWTEPYIDASTGETVITVSKAYYKNKKLVGVASIDVMVGTLINMVEKLQIGGTGYGIIIDSAGKYVAHPNSDLIGEKVATGYFEQIENTGNQGSVKDTENILSFTTNPITGWIIGGVINVEDFEKQAKTIILPILITLAIVLLIAIIVSIFVTNSITNPIKQVMDRMQMIADGDLSLDNLENKYDNEVGQLIISTNKMNQNMRHLLNQIHYVSEEVSNQSEELTQSANEVKIGTEQIATTMSKLASGSESQANSMSELSSIMNTFATRVEEANTNGENIQENSSKVLQLTDNGSQLMNSSTEQMMKINDIVKDAVGKMQTLEQHSQAISKLVAVIKEIADQTNLLALNAAIEAARAGEHGKGFSVVAEEVRKLAEQVAFSVNDITSIVTNIQKESTNVAESLKDGYSEVARGTVQIETTNETFTKISNAVSAMVTNIQSVSHHLSEIAANSQEMNSTIDEIAAVSEQSAAGVEETTASAQQASSAMEEIAGSSEHLAKLSEELHQLVGRFKL